ncbi:Uncharacterised protein [Salmonella enterica subsp. enterica serovar Bovismorbificans]|uniref:Uncharacterized protein n=1 Tax=Salmonella enterica subsp. enterica serovar Bovismorbificans TaxID=58097 RepID=A0A655EQ29_SALET|nr:Uncharacterised protein [Salmonella enterica subsp. enterica serovar Bovismorbificans]
MVTPGCAGTLAATGLPVNAIPAPPFTPIFSSATEPNFCCNTMPPPSFCHSWVKAFATRSPSALRGINSSGDCLPWS